MRSDGGIKPVAAFWKNGAHSGALFSTSPLSLFSLSCLFFAARPGDSRRWRRASSRQTCSQPRAAGAPDLQTGANYAFTPQRGHCGEEGRNSAHLRIYAGSRDHISRALAPENDISIHKVAKIIPCSTLFSGDRCRVLSSARAAAFHRSDWGKRGKQFPQDHDRH